MLLYQWVQYMTCLFSVPRRADCHDPVFPICWMCYEETRGGDVICVFSFISSNRCSGLGRSSSWKFFWDYPRRKSLVSCPATPHYEHTSRSVLLHSVPGDCGPTSDTSPASSRRSSHCSMYWCLCLQNHVTGSVFVSCYLLFTAERGKLSGLTASDICSGYGL